MSKELTAEKMTELSEALEAGRKIDAIKVYREATGLGLKDSKHAVEALHSDLHEKFPDKYPEPSKSAGCGSSAALFALTAGIVYLCWNFPA